MGSLWLLLAAVAAQRVPLNNYMNVSGTQLFYSLQVEVGTPPQPLSLMLEMSSTVKAM